MNRVQQKNSQMSLTFINWKFVLFLDCSTAAPMLPATCGRVPAYDCHSAQSCEQAIFHLPLQNANHRAVNEPGCIAGVLLQCPAGWQNTGFLDSIIPRVQDYAAPLVLEGCMLSCKPSVVGNAPCGSAAHGQHGALMHTACIMADDLKLLIQCPTSSKVLPL
jgi:hypothetical protein